MAWARRTDEWPNPDENEKPGAQLDRFTPSGCKKCSPGACSGDEWRCSNNVGVERDVDGRTDRTSHVAVAIAVPIETKIRVPDGATTAWLHLRLPENDPTAEAAADVFGMLHWTGSTVD
jgi:hypothetical protein